MKCPFYLRLIIFWTCVAFHFASTPTYAQGQPPPPAFLEIKSCGRELKVFEDGKVFISRDGQVTGRLLPASRMRKLRRIVGGAPCPRFWSPRPEPPEPPGPPLIRLDPDCSGPTIVSGILPVALQPVKVTLRSGGREGSFSVYIVRDTAKARDKEQVRRHYRTYINPKWGKFLSEAAEAVGGQGVLTGCAYPAGVSTKYARPNSSFNRTRNQLGCHRELGWSRRPARAPVNSGVSPLPLR